MRHVVAMHQDVDATVGDEPPSQRTVMCAGPHIANPVLRLPLLQFVEHATRPEYQILVVAGVDILGEEYVNRVRSDCRENFAQRRSQAAPGPRSTATGKNYLLAAFAKKGSEHIDKRFKTR